jgi:hypothetical protein
MPPPANLAAARVIASRCRRCNRRGVVAARVGEGDAASEFTAQIDWGDGTTSSGVIQEVTPGLFEVLGSHTYASDDWYTMTVTISQGWQQQVAVADKPAKGGDTPKVSFWVYKPSRATLLTYGYRR